MKFFFTFIVVMSGLLVYNSLAYFDSLPEIVTYASRIPDDTPNESVDPYHTQFNELHNKIPSLTDPSFLSRLWYGRERTVTEFKKLLSAVGKRRELDGFYGDFVQKFYIVDETRWCVLGGLHGAFHSLVRGLLELKKINSMNDDLLLLQSNIYLVFNGDLINYGAYQIETLLLILKLAQKNPSQVILNKGSLEQKGVWQKTNFSDELRTRISTKTGGIPLEKEINTFFNTFSLATYLVSAEGDVVRISFYDTHPLLKETMWGDFFNIKHTETRKIKYIISEPIKQVVKTRIETHEVKEIPYTIDGLSYEKAGDINKWQTFSAPLNIFKAYFNFYEDTLVQLTTGRYFSSWLLTLLRQDLYDPKGFFRIREFEVATGREIFTANPAKRIDDLTEKIELAEIEKKHLQEACMAKKAKTTEVVQSEHKIEADKKAESKK